MAPSKQRKRQTAGTGSLKRPPVLSTGPRLYREAKHHGYRGGPGTPPDGFVIGTTSSYEWTFYWAMSKVFGQPEDPRAGPPFYGGDPYWRYQKGFDGGRHGPGGSVIDFLAYGGRGKNASDMAFRIQTEYFHIYTAMENQFHDQVQFERLSEFMTVIDIYDYEFAADPTGRSAILLITRALNGEISPSPITESNVAMRVRDNRIG